MLKSANTEIESVVSEDATVQSVNAEETVNDGITVEEGMADLLEVEEIIPLEPIIPVLEPIIEPLVEEPIKEDEYKIKCGDKWFKSWRPYALVDTEEEAGIFNEDWARGYSSSLRMLKKQSPQIVKL